jgi:hypothetical protein
MVSAIGARRRLQALANRGWSAGAIGREGLGISASQAARVLDGAGQVSPGLAAIVAGAYDALWTRKPPQATATQRDAARAQQERAERAGWAPPLAWDDDELDEPGAVPAEGWRRSDRTTIRSADLVEDARFVREAGGYRTQAEVAMRLGVSRDRLDHAYIRAGDRQAETEREAG